MKTLIKIIMAILGILGLSGKASAKKKAEVKKINKKVPWPTKIAILWGQIVNIVKVEII